ncbi:uncharacterized protein LOC129894563 [Solanum dulcamara]|uniref:uncharacterized protein LOC129894563 n=1 Tax=Solanum dulcamara TaxID=45834 RepID=UPI0024857DAF|nr:uncharacterized protein LOC129894563 [Solanum dulcamara]
MKLSKFAQIKFYPALTVTNIKSLVPVILDNEQGLYHSWATLFINLARVYDLYYHLVSPTEASALAAYTTAKSADPALWKHLDAVILQCIYTTIAPDLLLVILKCNDTRLADVDAPVTNSHLVLRLTGSLPEVYSCTVDFIQNQEPLPPFESCHSKLKMAERTIKARQARENSMSGSRADSSAIVATPSSSSNDSFASNKRNNNNKNRNNSKSNDKKKATQQSPSGPSLNQPPH